MRLPPRLKKTTASSCAPTSPPSSSAATSSLSRWLPCARPPLLVAEPPDGGVPAWLAVGSAFCVYGVAVGLQYVAGVFYGAWLKQPELGPAAGATALAWATSTECACFLAGSLIAGKLIAASSPRAAVLVGGALFLVGAQAAGIAGATSGVAASVGTGGRLAVLYVFFGIMVGLGCSIAHVAALIGVQAFFARRRGLATGLTVAGSGVGAFVMGPVCEALIASSSWGTALAVMGGAAAIICLAAAAVLVPVHVQAAPATTAASTDVGEDADCADGSKSSLPPLPPLSPDVPAAASECNSPRTYSELIRTPFARSFGLYIAMFALCWFMVPTFLPSFATRGLGGSSADSGGLVASQGASNTLGRVLLGLAADRWPHRKRDMLTICMLSVAMAATALAVAPSLWLAYIFAVVLGGFGGSVISMLPPLAVEALGLPALPLATGFFNALQAPFALAGAPVGSAILTAGAAAGWSVGRAYSLLWGFVAAMFCTTALATRAIVSERSAQGLASLPPPELLHLRDGAVSSPP